VVLVLNTCGENRARLRRGGIAVASCPSTEQFLDAEHFLASTSRRTTSCRTTSRRVMSLNRTICRRRTTSRRTTSRRTTSRRRTLFSQTTGTNCGYKPRISSSSSGGEVLSRAHHRKGSLHRSAEKGFCCVSSRSCGSTPKTNSHRMLLHTTETSLPGSTHHSHTPLAHINSILNTHSDRNTHDTSSHEMPDPGPMCNIRCKHEMVI